MTSERFILQASGKDIGNLDLHYLANGSVAATMVLLSDSGITDDSVPALLDFIDTTLLPEQRLDAYNLSFTVFRSEVIGTFASERSA